MTDDLISGLRDPLMVLANGDDALVKLCAEAAGRLTAVTDERDRLRFAIEVLRTDPGPWLPKVFDEALADGPKALTPARAARVIVDEVLQKTSYPARDLRVAMIKATMATKVPALVSWVRWRVVCDALFWLAKSDGKGKRE